MEKTQRRVWWQTALITVVAISVFVTVRLIPVHGSDLHYTDFHAGGKSFLEFCEPGSPQFAPVDQVRSPVTLTLSPLAPAVAGEPVQVEVGLTTSSGKRILMDDLLVVHTEKLHLLIIGPGLEDYHHAHPKQTGEGGVFSFSFTPNDAGLYKVFADFMPRATGRSLYAGGEIAVSPRIESAGSSAKHESNVEEFVSLVDGLRFQLSVPNDGFRINQSATIQLFVTREDGSPVVLEEVMGASAHLVAFDSARSGFAHLHPLVDPAGPALDGLPASGDLTFSLYLTDPGFYRLWAQVKVDGNEHYAPFDLRVIP